MTASTRAKIPAHLNRYIVEQNYARYTPEDQAVWRYIMRQLKNFLSVHGHASYLDGLKKTGLTVEHIPRISEIDSHLEKFGWGAVPVSGFIPPAAFMEFQAIGVLPIASDMRSLDHLLYTPAPDIVHEAAGHAPILIVPEYGAYLRQYGEVARHAIISKEDLAQYEAIRILSDLKEDPSSTPEEIENAELALAKINSSMSKTSEAALLSRMNWWTAEYGLIGDLKNPRIFGAGLLSSVGESRACLSAAVKKIPLSVDCVDYTYDITEQQPQLFVARDFAQLGEVLEKLAQSMAYRRGGRFGLDLAKEAETINTVQLNSRLQISGLLKNYLVDDHGTPAYLQFMGPTQLSTNYAELEGQGVQHHSHGFSSPVGLVKGQSRCMSEFSPLELENLGLRRGQAAVLEFTTGVRVEGTVASWTYYGGTLVVLTWKDCNVKLGDQVLFEPAWGDYDMAVGSFVASVFGGPADRERYGATDDFVAKVIPSKKFGAEQIERHQFYSKTRELRLSPDAAHAPDLFARLREMYLRNPKRNWLQGIELLELTYRIKGAESGRDELLQSVGTQYFNSPAAQECVRDGVSLAPTSL